MSEDIKTKKCNRCGLILPVSDFDIYHTGPNLLERAKADQCARENGAQWTDDTDELFDELIAEVEDLRGKYQYMVDCAANEKLDGYRELGRWAADAEAEVEWLRSEDKPCMCENFVELRDNLRAEIAAKDVRIKELEAELEDLGRDFAIQVGYAERLEAAFLEAKSDMIYFQDAPNREAELIELYDEAEHKAREALERMRAGGKDE